TDGSLTPPGGRRGGHQRVALHAEAVDTDLADRAVRLELDAGERPERLELVVAHDGSDPARDERADAVGRAGDGVVREGGTLREGRHAVVLREIRTVSRLAGVE